MAKNIGVILALRNQCSPQLKKIASDLGVTEKEAKKVSRTVKNLAKEMNEGITKASVVMSAGLGAVIASTSALAMKTGETCDRIDDMSNKIGISRKGFQEWDYLLEQNGANIESLQMGFKTLTNQVTKANEGNKESAKIFKTLGISIKDSNGKLKNQEEIFNELVPALQKMPEGVQKAKIANDLLGRSGSELMPLFNATTEQLAKQREEYQKLSLTISDEVIDAGNLFGDNIAKWQMIIRSFGASIGGEVLPIINDLSETFISELPKIKATVTPILKAIVNSFKFLVEHIELVTFVATTLVSTFVAFKTIGTVITIIGNLKKIIEAVTVAQGVWNAIMIANPIGAIAVGVGLLIGGVVLLIRNWDKVKEAVTNFATSAKAVLSDLWAKVKPIFENIAKFAQIAFSFTPVGMAMNVAKQLKPQKHALGTSSASGGLSLVGEYGPELVNLQKGSSVTPANKTRQILSGQSLNIPVSITVNGNIYGEEDLVNKIIDRMTLELNRVIPV